VIQLAPIARTLGRAVLDALLPSHCLTCDALVDAPGQLCPDCFRATTVITAPLCLRCGAPFPHRTAFAAVMCDDCAAAPPPWGEARAALTYDSQSRRMLLPFKHADRTELATALARMMARAGSGLLARADLLVPVPLHRFRLLSRRYNQSALLARALSRLSGVPCLPDALRRIRATQSLGTLSSAARDRMLAGAIGPRRGAALAGRRILLIDDVLTSGATARACTNALLAAGAAGVDVLVAARAGRPLHRAPLRHTSGDTTISG
jgi:ComF family protein